MAGRPPKAIEVRQREGTFDPEKHNLPVVLGKRELPSAPLNLTSDQMMIWDEVVDDLESILTTSDRYTVEQFVICVSRLREAKDHIDTYGVIVQGHGGKFVKNQGLEVERHYMQLAITLGNLLGLSPSARARLGLQAIQGRTAMQNLSDKIGDSPFDTPPPDGRMTEMATKGGA